jgi:uncharacterized membrane protein YvbJ
MVYCPKCGTKNEDTADFCVKCGASLKTGTVSSRRYERRRAQQECFGLPHGGAIAGIVFGAIILIGGLLLLLQETETIEIADASIFGYILIIVFGILILAGALYRATHSKTNPLQHFFVQREQMF